MLNKNKLSKVFVTKRAKQDRVRNAPVDGTVIFCIAKKVFWRGYGGKKSWDEYPDGASCRRHGGFFIKKNGFNDYSLENGDSNGEFKWRTPTERGGNACGEN